MVSNFKSLALLFVCASIFSSCSRENKVTLTVIDPGHFHASLLQKNMIEGLSEDVQVYAPQGEELNSYLNTIESYNSRQENPTSWREYVYEGEDYLSALPVSSDSRGVVMLSGNNKKKTGYILTAVDKGYNVLADKPLAINEEQWETLKDAYILARKKGLVIYDLMTERYDTLNILVRNIIADKELFGELDCSNGPAVRMTSVHHFYKEVSGVALHRPTWYYDVTQQGEGIADVTTHLIDLVFWQCFPGKSITTEMVSVDSTSHYPTPISLEQFKLSTLSDSFPSFLSGVKNGNQIDVLSNGTIGFSVCGVPVQMNVKWNWMPQPGASDTFEAVYKGTKSTVIVRQDSTTGFVKQVFVCPDGGKEQMLDVPLDCRIGHEDHFNLVAGSFLRFVRGEDVVPEWESQNTLTKYFITTTAAKLASN